MAEIKNIDHANVEVLSIWTWIWELILKFLKKEIADIEDRLVAIPVGTCQNFTGPFISIKGHHFELAIKRTD